MADILVVEDKESLRAMLRKTLEGRGYSVEEAADAYEARRKLQGARYLVVLTDLKLPAGTGFEVLQAAQEVDRDVPVLVMTAFGLAVAIPAVLGYNMLVRTNKGVVSQLNGFAHQLHAYFLTGAPVSRPELKLASSKREAG